jgi:hypothetical protein
VLAFGIGLYPKPLFQVLERPTAQIVERVRHSSPVAENARRPLILNALSGQTEPPAPPTGRSPTGSGW